MRARKVLLLTYHFPPSGAVAVHRMLGLVRHLPPLGWQPVVVAPPVAPGEPEDLRLLTQVPPETPVVRVPLASGLWGKVVRRIAPYRHWLPRAARACRRLIAEHRPEAIITSSPPCGIHYLGLYLQARYRLPWLACFRDPWVVNTHLPPRTFVFRFDQFGEPLVVRRADRVIANSPLCLEGLQRAYPEQAHKCVVITNGFEPGAPVPPPSPRADEVTLLHAGEFYSGRDPRPLLDALAQLRTEAGLPKLRLSLLGRDTEGCSDLDAECRRRGLEDRVDLPAQVPHEEALRRMQQADVLVLVQTPGYRVTVPAKLYEYLGMRRPILALAEPDGDIAWVLRESGVLHRLAPPTDVAQIRQALLELTRELQQGTPVSGDPAALARFTRAYMAERFAEELDACTRPQSGLIVARGEVCAKR